MNYKEKESLKSKLYLHSFNCILTFVSFHFIGLQTSIRSCLREIGFKETLFEIFLLTLLPEKQVDLFSKGFKLLFELFDEFLFYSILFRLIYFQLDWFLELHSLFCRYNYCVPKIAAGFNKLYFSYLQTVFLYSLYLKLILIGLISEYYFKNILEIIELDQLLLRFLSQQIL